MDLKRTAIAILVVIVVGTLLNPFAPQLDPDQTNVDQYIFWSQVDNAIRLFVATFIGGIIARRNFVGPAVLFAFTVWGFAMYIVYDIARVAGKADIAEILTQNLLGLFFGMLAASIGAYFGGWFYDVQIRESNSAT